jgi:hypothetical protein
MINKPLFRVLSEELNEEVTLSYMVKFGDGNKI